MRPLALDDLVSLEEYAAGRAEFFAAHVRYRDRYRRVRIGPKMTLIFENRQTLWFRMQEVLRVARLVEPNFIEKELAVYNRLLPGHDEIQASLLLEFDESRWAEESKFWSSLAGENIRFVLDSIAVPANLITCRPEDRAAGASHWLQFNLGEEEQKALAEFRRPARLEVQYPGYQYVSSNLSEEMRKSLLDDLQLSARDAAA
jgi:hypothetical protein